MSDQQAGPDSVPGAEPTAAEQPVDSTRRSEAAQAWSEVVSELDSLGDALGRWVKAAVNDPENQRRAGELSSRLESFVSQVGTTIQGAASSEVGESFREAAEKTGEAFRQAGEKISEEVGPRLSGAFRSAADRLSKAAGRMEDRAQPAAEAPESAPATDSAAPTDGAKSETSGEE